MLNRSEAARDAVVQALNAAGAEIPTGLRFRTHAAESDGTIADLIGEDGIGRQALLIEAKFWAGFTDQQPVAYLRRLAKGGGGTLAVVAPAARIEHLWLELVRRCENERLVVETHTAAGGESRSAKVEPGGRLLLVSWRGLLNAVRSAVEFAGETVLAADVLQLQGLCDRMDEEAFLPLRSEVLTSDTGRRIIQFNKLVEDAYGRLSRESYVDGSGLRSASGSGWYGRYTRLHGVASLFHASMGQWSENAATPIWLRLNNATSRGRSPKVEEKLRSGGLRERQDFFSSEWGTFVPVYLPAGVERERVLDTMVSQVERIAALLADPGPDASGEAAVLPPEPEEELAIEPGVP